MEEPTWDDEPAAKPSQSAPIEEPKPKEEVAAPAPAQPEQAPVLSALPAQLQAPVPKTEAPIPPVKPATPVSHTRPTSAAHRHSARFKSDQAVVMPSSFSANIEKIGMQFGSLGLGGEEVEPSA